MPNYYTCITQDRHISQHEAKSPEHALRLHIATLPYDDGSGPFDAELDWLRMIAGGGTQVTMEPLTQCRNTWFWLDGARYTPQYLTYIVKTDMAGD